MKSKSEQEREAKEVLITVLQDMIKKHFESIEFEGVVLGCDVYSFNNESGHIWIPTLIISSETKSEECVFCELDKDPKIGEYIINNDLMVEFRENE